MLLGRHGTFTAVVEPGRQTALVRAIVLEDLDLLVDCVGPRVVPRDPGGETPVYGSCSFISGGEDFGGPFASAVGTDLRSCSYLPRT